MERAAGTLRPQGGNTEVNRGPNFLRLATTLSALYPKESQEKPLLGTMLLRSRARERREAHAMFNRITFDPKIMGGGLASEECASQFR